MDRPQLIPGAPTHEQASFARGVLLVGLVFALTRLVTWTGVYAGALMHFRIAMDIPPPFEKQLGPPPQRDLIGRLRDPGTREAQWFNEHISGLAPLCYWDGGWFQQIIVYGYSYAPPAPGEQHNIAYFPLYPLACRAAAELLAGFPGDLRDPARRPLVRAAMVTISHAAGLAAALFLYAWSRRLCGHRAALIAAATLLCFPTACYLSFGYSESLAVLLAVGAAILIERCRFVAAAIVVGLATASRPTAIALVIVLIFAIVQRPETPIRRRVGAAALGAVIGSLGLAGYGAYLAYRFGSPFVYFDNFRVGWIGPDPNSSLVEVLLLKPLIGSAMHLVGAFANPPLSLIDLIAPRTWNVPLVALLLLVSIAGWRRVGPAYRPLLLIAPLVFLQAYASGGRVGSGIASLARYMLLATPSIALLGVWMSREWPAWLRHAVLAMFLALQGSWAFHFGLKEWHG